MSTMNTKVNLFSVLPTPTTAAGSNMADGVVRADSSSGKSFNSTLDKAREQISQVKDSLDKAKAAVENSAVTEKPAAANKPEAQAEEPDDAVKAAVKSGEVLTLLIAPEQQLAELETEELVPADDPVANPVEALTAVEAIGQEADRNSGRTPLAMIQGDALAELLPDSTEGKANSALLNELSGRYDGEVTIGQQASVPIGDAQNLEGLLVNTAGNIADDLVAMTAATASRALGLNQPQADDTQTLMSRSDIVVENQVLDDSSALGLTNVKISDEAKSSLAGDMPQTAQQELSQVISGMREEIEERLTNPKDDPEDKRTAIPQVILDGAAAKNPELYLTKTARQMGIHHEADDKSSLAAGISSQPQQIEQQPEQVQEPQTTRTADVYDIRQQIVDQVRMIRTAQTTELVMQLKPEHLGQLTMRVSVANNGAVTAVFQSENAQVRAAVESQLTQLKQELQQQGLKVDNVSVGAGLSEDFFTRGETQGQMSQFAQQQSQQAGTNGNGNRRADGIAGVDGVEGIAAAEGGINTAGVVSTDASNPVNNATDTILDYRV